MPHLSPRACAGFGLILLTALGPAVGTPAAAPVAAPDPDAPAPPVAVDSPHAAPMLIPCVSGMCQVPLHGPAAAITPLRPAPPATGDEPPPYTAAAIGDKP